MMEVDVDLDNEQIQLFLTSASGPLNLSTEEAEDFADDLKNAVRKIERHKEEKEREKKKEKAEKLEPPDFTKKEIMERIVEVLPDNREDAVAKDPEKGYPINNYTISKRILNKYYECEDADFSEEIWRYNEEIMKVERKLDMRIPQLIRHRGDEYGIKSSDEPYWSSKVYWIENTEAEE